MPRVPRVTRAPRVTAKTLAEKLGLARSTVTMALADSPKINAATRSRVQAAAKELGYIPNSIARAMKQGSVNTIGFILTSPGEHTFRMLIGAMEAAQEAGYHIKVIHAGSHSNPRELAQQCVAQCLAGVAITSTAVKEITLWHDHLSSAGIPIAGLQAPHPLPFSAWTDDTTGVEEAIELLYRLDHRKIGFIGGDPGTHSHTIRHRAFLHAMKAHSLPVEHGFVVACDYDPLKVERVVRTMLAPRNNRPTALLCANDPMAMVAIRTARQMRLKVPEDLSVIGFSDLEMAEYCDPPLTSVSLDYEQVGREAIRAIVRTLKDKEDITGEEACIPTRLVIRESTAVAPS